MGGTTRDNRTLERVDARIEGHVLSEDRGVSKQDHPVAESDSGNDKRTYGFHIHTLLQLYHNIVDAILQKRPSVAVSQ